MELLEDKEAGRTSSKPASSLPYGSSYSLRTLLRPSSCPSSSLSSSSLARKPGILARLRSPAAPAARSCRRSRRSMRSSAARRASASSEKSSSSLRPVASYASSLRFSM